MLRRFFTTPDPIETAIPTPPTTPVPARLRERLKDHPEHVARLQQVLNSAADAQGRPNQRFEEAVRALEGRLGSFLVEARTELDAARSRGDADLVAKAEAKERLMSEIRLKQVWIGDPVMWGHFQPDDEVPQ